MWTTTRNPLPVVTRTILAIVFGVFLIALLYAAWYVRAAIPRVDGRFEAPGLGAVAYIRRDDRGTPHIEAQTLHDVLYAEGFACAQDRLWQMDTMRRQAEGRLSELAGPVTLDDDRYMRKLGLGAAAEADVRALDPQTRAALEAYAAGVNAEAESHWLPIEFRLIVYDWEPWTPKDTIAIAKLMAQHLDDQWYYLDVRSQLNDKVGTEAAGALTDMQVRAFETHIPGYDQTRVGTRPSIAFSQRARSKNAQPQLGALLQGIPDWPRHENDTGSNNWAVTGARTSTHRPVLSNDTHLDTALPNTWWIAHLHGGGLDVAGFTLPGIPGIVLGHNEHIAFGVTSTNEAVQDLYVEHFRSPASDEYLANGKWLRAQHRIERIRVKGQSDEALDVLVTRHGPVIRRDGTRGVALAWTILQRRDDGRALLAWDRAQNYQQIRAALSHLVGPVLNFVYADTAGHIGYQAAGVVPLRANGDGSLPVEGQDDRFAWRGLVPYDALPHAFDPPKGYITTANGELVPPSFRPILSTYFAPPFRTFRIAARLEQARGATPAQIGAIQGDTLDVPRLQLARATARALASSSDPAMTRIAAQLGSWDGMMNADSHAATFVMTEEAHVLKDLLEPRLGTPLYQKYLANYSPAVALFRVFGGDRRMRAIGITRESLLAELPRAASETAKELRADGSRGLDADPAWGVRNAAVYRHPLSAKWVLGFLSIPPISQPGSGLAVYAGKPYHGPSQRLVVDLSDLDNTTMLLPLGESGVYSDPHYDDQVDDFVHIRMDPMPFTQSAVLGATRHTLVLEPSR
jgi:penicillin G amidase